MSTNDMMAVGEPLELNPRCSAAITRSEFLASIEISWLPQTTLKRFFSRRATRSARTLSSSVYEQFLPLLIGIKNLAAKQG